MTKLESVANIVQFATNCAKDINEKTNQSIDWREHLKLASPQGLSL